MDVTVTVNASAPVVIQPNTTTNGDATTVQTLPLNRPSPRPTRPIASAVRLASSSASSTRALKTFKWRRVCVGRPPPARANSQRLEPGNIGARAHARLLDGPNGRRHTRGGVAEIVDLGVDGHENAGIPRHRITVRQPLVQGS